MVLALHFALLGLEAAIEQVETAASKPQPVRQRPLQSLERACPPYSTHGILQKGISHVTNREITRDFSDH